jgi:hypothetical protein
MFDQICHRLQQEQSNCLYDWPFRAFSGAFRFFTIYVGLRHYTNYPTKPVIPPGLANWYQLHRWGKVALSQIIGLPVH